ncbi:MAG TPA: thiolase family protein [Pyrinomonadaceae bacterium]|nr:thiolase family protein [Pyrinomonadaceae bacterium]
MRDVYVLGVGLHPFGRFADKDVIEIGREAVLRAIDDAGLPWQKVAAAYCGTVFAGPMAGNKVLSLVGLTGIPIVNVENACASGGSALREAYQAVAGGFSDAALAFGIEKMPKGFIAGNPNDWFAVMGLAVNPQYFALKARWHMANFGTTEKHLVQVSVKNHQNGALNPFAMYRRAMSFEEIAQSQMVNDPLRLLMLCSPNEGAGAVVLCSKDIARQYTTKPIKLAAIVLDSPIYGTAEVPHISVSARVEAPTVTMTAAQEAYEAAGIGPEDLDVVELQDTDSASEIIYTEELGLCSRGEGAKLLDDGATEIEGRIPINVSGGLLSKGEPLGASALAQVVEVVWQLRGEAGTRQVKNARTGLTHVYGALGNCAVSVLQG